MIDEACPVTKVIFEVIESTLFLPCKTKNKFDNCDFPVWINSNKLQEDVKVSKSMYREGQRKIALQNAVSKTRYSHNY